MQSAAEPLGVRIVGDGSSLHNEFNRSINDLNNWVKSVEFGCGSVVKTIAKTNAAIKKGLSFGGIGSGPAGAGSAPTAEVDKMLAGLKRLHAERKLGIITEEQYKRKLQETAAAAKAGSQVQMSALLALRRVEDAHTQEMTRASNRQIADAERVAKAREREERKTTKAIEREAKLQESARKRGNPVAQAILTSRIAAPGGGMQPLVGRTGNALGMDGNTTAIAGVAAGVAGVVGAAVIGQGKEAIKQAADFEQAMDVLGQQAGATDTQLDKLRDTARQLGNDETLSATSSVDAAEAMLELSKAGLSVEDTQNAARGALNLASAAQIGAGDAAKVTASNLRAFNLEGSEATRVADLLAATANSSLGDIQDMAGAAQQAAAAFAAVHEPIENMYTALGLLANAGIKNSDAGTSMKTMLARLNPEAKDAREIMKRLGIETYDAQGKFVGMRSVIGQFEEKLKNATDEQRQFALQTIFGSDAQRAANILISGGVKQYDEMKKKVVKVGAAAETTGAQMKGLKGQVDNLGSAWSSFLEHQGSPVLEWLTDVTKGTAGAIRALDTWIDRLKGAKDIEKAQLESSGVESFRKRANDNRSLIKDLYGAKGGRIEGAELTEQEKVSNNIVGRAIAGPTGAKVLNAYANSRGQKRLRTLKAAGLSPNASEEEIDAKIAELKVSARTDEDAAEKMQVSVEARINEKIQKRLKENAEAAAKKKKKNPNAGKGDPVLAALMAERDALRKKLAKGTGGYSPPAIFDVPETVPMAIRSGKRSYDDDLLDIDDAFAKKKADAMKSGAVVDEYSLALDRLQRRLSVARSTVAETDAKIADLSPKVEVQETDYIEATAAYNSFARALDARMKVRGYKVTEADRIGLKAKYNRMEDTKSLHSANSQLLEGYKSTNRTAHRQESDDTVSLVETTTDFLTKSRETYLKKLQDKLATGEGNYKTADFEADLQAAMNHLIEDGGEGAVNGEGYQMYRSALLDSTAKRRDTFSSVRKRTKGDTKEQAIKALDEEYKTMSDSAVTDDEKKAATEFHDSELRKINQKFYADKLRDDREFYADEMEAGKKSRAEYRDFLVSSLEETRAQFGNTSKEVAALNTEIRRLDWQVVEDDATAFRESMDAGDISIRDYIGSLQRLQARVSETSQPYRQLQKDIDAANRTVRDGHRRTADDIGGRAGDAVVSVVRGRAKLGAVLEETASEAFDDALKTAIKRNVSKLAFQLLGQKDLADRAKEVANKAKEAADIQDGAANKNLAAGQMNLEAANKTAGGVATAGAAGTATTSVPGAAGDNSKGSAAGIVGTFSKIADYGTKISGTVSGAMSGITQTAKSVTNSATKATDFLTKHKAMSSGTAKDIGNFAATAGKWLGYAGAAYAGFEFIKSLHAAQERGFQMKQGTSRYASLGNGDHTGYFDTSNYAGSEGIRRLNQRGESRMDRGTVQHISNNIAAGAIVINGAGKNAQHVAREVMDMISQQTALDNSFRGVTS